MIFIVILNTISGKNSIHLIIQIFILQGLKQASIKKVIGKFKDEAAGNHITHFIGLRPKLYTFKVETKYKKDKKREVKEINMIEEDKQKKKE